MKTILPQINGIKAAFIPPATNDGEISPATSSASKELINPMTVHAKPINSAIKPKKKNRFFILQIFFYQISS